jgi:pimeloyl-ACP methyl ester carboxylesterase
MLYKSAEGERVVMEIYDRVLATWSAPYETEKVRTRHGETFVIASGNSLAPTMILLHGGGGGNSTMWAEDVAEYSRHFRVYALDLPGEAGKSDPNRPSWEGTAFAEWLTDVLDALHVERATLVGLSQGAWTAIKFAVENPHRVEKLILMSPGGIVPDRTSFIFYAIAMSLLGKRGTQRMVHNLFGDVSVPQEVEDRFVQVIDHFKPRLGLLPIFTDAELSRLTMPILLIGGTKDMMRDIGKIEARLRCFLPDLTVMMVRGGGHALIDVSDSICKFATQIPTVVQSAP